MKKKKLILNLAAVAFAALSFSALSSTNSTTFAMESTSNVASVNDNRQKEIKRIERKIKKQKTKLKDLFWDTDICSANPVSFYSDLDFVDDSSSSELYDSVDSKTPYTLSDSVARKARRIIARIEKLENSL